jgi:pilus assembly protein CpaF
MRPADGVDGAGLGVPARPGNGADLQAAVRERTRARLRRTLAARSAVSPSKDDENWVWGVIKEEIDAVNREAMLSGQPLLDDRGDRLTRRVFDDVLRYGPISQLLDDPSCEEVMINAPDRVYRVRRGADGVTRTELTTIVFANDDEVTGVVRRIVGPLGRRMDESSPMVDARLPDGSRLHAIMPPLTGGHVAVTIRKHTLRAQSMEDLIRLGTLNREAARFLSAAIVAGVNGLICGGAASGKTTTLNCLGSLLTAFRVVTIEDTLELKLASSLGNCVALEARPPNVEGKGEVTIRALVREALRMRPDRIVVGECRGGEALDMLLAMNSGHPGSLSTIHADSPHDALLRLKTYVLMGAVDLPERAVLELIASAIQLVIFQRRAPDGRRLVESIYEVTGLEGTTIVGNELYRRQGGELVWTGLRARCEATIRDAGLAVPW